jgi:hypothetical protein
MARDPDYVLLLNELDVIDVNPKVQIFGLTLSALSLQQKTYKLISWLIAER